MKIKNNFVQKEMQDFRNFAFKGNIMDLAVGVIIGGAFGKIVSSLVSDLIMPLLSVVTGNMKIESLFIALDGNKYASIEEAAAASAATLNYGLFITAIIDFLIIATAIFIFLKQINRINNKFKKSEPEAPPAEILKECRFCKNAIKPEAIKCPYCTADLPQEKD
jgi:large conductance mechanosensitive channel